MSEIAHQCIVVVMMQTVVMVMIAVVKNHHGDVDDSEDGDRIVPNIVVSEVLLGSLPLSTIV